MDTKLEQKVDVLARVCSSVGAISCTGLTFSLGLGSYSFVQDFIKEFQRQDFGDAAFYATYGVILGGSALLALVGTYYLSKYSVAGKF